MGDVSPDTMVKELQLVKRLVDIAKSFDGYVENPTETTRLMSCLDDLHQISSLLNLLGWGAAAYLVDKIRLNVQALLQTSSGNQTISCQDTNKIYHYLQESLTVLPILLEKTDEQQATAINQHCQRLDSLSLNRLSPASYLPACSPLLSSEATNVEPLIANSKVLSNRHLQALEQRDMRSWLRKTRQLLQAGTLQLLRDDDLASASKRLQLCFSKLNRGCGYTQHGSVWLPALIFTEWLQNQSILPVTIRSILRQLDLHLKQVADGSLEHLNQPPADLLILQLLLYPNLTTESRDWFNQRFYRRLADSGYSIHESFTVAHATGLILLSTAALRQELAEIDSLTTDARQKCRQLAERIQGCIDLTQLLNQEAISVLFLQQQRQLRRLSVSGEKDFQAYQPICLLVMDQILHRLQPLIDFNDDLANVVFHSQSETIVHAYQQIRQIQTELCILNRPHPEQGQLALLLGHLQQFEMTLIHIKIPRLTAVIAALSNTLQQIRMASELPVIPFYQVWAEIFCAVHFTLDRLLLDHNTNSQQQTSHTIQRAEQALAILNAEAGVSPSLAMDERESDEADLLALISQEFDDQLKILQQQWSSYCNKRTSSALAKMRLAFHTIKGSSRVVGAHLMADLAWSSEEICTRLLEDCYDMTPELTTVIDDSIHWISRLMQLVQQGAEADSDLRQAIESGREVINHWLDHCFELNVSDILTDDIDQPCNALAELSAVNQVRVNDAVVDISSPAIDSPNDADTELLIRQLRAEIIPQRQALQDFIRQSWRENFSNLIPSELVRQLEQFCLNASTALLPQLPELAHQIQQLIVVTPRHANGSALTDLLARYEQLLLDIDEYLPTLSMKESSIDYDELVTHQESLIQDSQRYIAKWHDQMQLPSRIVDSSPEPSQHDQSSNTNSHGYDRVLNRLIEIDALLGHWIRAANKEDLLQINSHLDEVLTLTVDDELSSIYHLAEALQQFFNRLIQSPIFDSTVNGATGYIHGEIIELASTGHDALLNMMDQVVAGQSPSMNGDCVQALNDYVLADQTMLPVDTFSSAGGEVELVDQETAVVMAIFLEEAEEIAEAMEQSLHQWQTSPNNWVAAGELQSAAATLGSGAKMAQLNDLENLCTVLESVYRSMIDTKYAIDEKWSRLLQRSQDIISQAITNLLNNPAMKIKLDVSSVIQQLNELVITITNASIQLDKPQTGLIAANDGEMEFTELLNSDQVHKNIDDTELNSNAKNKAMAKEIQQLMREVNSITQVIDNLSNKPDKGHLVDNDAVSNLLKNLQVRLRSHVQNVLDNLDP